MAVVANVGINVDSRGAESKLRQVANRGKEVEKAFNGVNTSLQKSKGSFAAAGDAANRANRSFAGLGKTFAGLAASYASLSTAQSVLNTTISRVESERRIELLAKSYGEVAELQDAATKAAKRFGTGQTEANRALADVFARLRPIGTSLEDIVSIYNGFNTAARNSGATAVESANAFRQLSQALGSGALRGDEFNSIAEQVPGILTAIAQETGVAQGQLRKYAAEGKITADVVTRALKRIEEEGADQLAESLEGPQQGLTDLTNRTEDLQVAIGRLALPAVLSIVDDLATATKKWVTTVDKLSYSFSGLADFLDPAIQKVSELNDLLANIPINPLAFALNAIPGLAEKLPGPVEKEAIEGFDQLSDAEIRQALALANRRQPRTTITLPTKGKGRGVGRERKPEKSLEQQIRERAALLQVEKEISQARLQGNERLQIQLEAYKRQLEIKQRELASGLEKIELDRNGVQLEEKLELLRRDKAEQQRQFILGLFEEDDARKQALQTLDLQITKGSEFVQQLNQIKNLVFEQGLSFEEAYKRVSQLKEGISETEQILNSVGQAISTGIVDALTSAVEGTKTLGEVAADVLKNIAKLLLNTGVNLLMGSAGGGGLLGALFPKRANGGPVTGSKPYMVGERGPELFVPRSSGTIIPNDKMMGGSSNVVVNVDASGTKVQGDNNEASQLGKAIGAAVQAELVKQKRPGGLLAGV